MGSSTRVVSQGSYRTCKASFVRPANTTAYSAGQVVNNSTSAGAVLTFPQATLDSNIGALIVQAVCIDEANVATHADLQLFLFSAAPAAVNDGAAFAPSNAEMETLLGVIAFPVASWVVGLSGAGAGGNAVCDSQGLGVSIKTAGGVNAIYGVLVVRNGYVPVSNEKFVISLKVID